jgi:hypothetical protein
MLSTQAPGAQVEPFWFAIYKNGSRVNIGHPAALSMTLGMAHIITKLRRFTTQITLQNFFPLDR